MFFWKKSGAATPQKAVQETGWDDETMASYAKSNQFNVQITSVTKRYGFGAAHEGDYMREPNGYEIFGLIPYPRYIPVIVSLQQRDDQFGGWMYHMLDDPGGTHKTGMPMLDVWLSDPELKIGEAIFESHRAALTSGCRASRLRLWKRPGDGVMTARDRDEGYSSESRYPLLGLYSWGDLESVKLPAWAVPVANERFAFERKPRWYDLR
jgi:hypothetical protein